MITLVSSFLSAALLSLQVVAKLKKPALIITITNFIAKRPWFPLPYPLLNLYPTDRIVSKYFGSLGSFSKIFRSFRMKLSTVRFVG